MNNNLKFLIGKPKIYPENLIEELKILFSKLPNIKSACIAQIFVPGSGMPAHPIIGVDMEGDLNDIADKLGNVINRNSKKDECIEMCSINTGGLSEYFKKIKPFYIKKI